MIGIIGAMDIECDPIKAAIADKKINGHDGCTIPGMEFISGTIEGKEVVIVKCGVGKTSAAICTVSMIHSYPVDTVINVGVAGGLSPDLSVLDVVIADSTLQHDTDFTDGDKVICSPDVVAGLKQACDELNIKSLIGTVATGDQIMNPNARQAVRKKYNAATSDMEGAAIAKVCATNDIEFGIIRAMSNVTDENAGAEYAQFRDPAAEVAAKVVLQFIKSYDLGQKQSPRTSFEKKH